MSEVRDVPVAAIRLDPKAQPRDHINKDKIGEYAEAMMLGDQFPPLVVFYDAENGVYWLADGFHRLHSALGCEYATYPCEVHEGTLRDAILYSVGANAQHGYPRSTDDKRRSIRRLLNDPEWRQWSDREIAKRCRVDSKTVARQRAEIEAHTAEIRSMDRTFIHPKTGEPTTMATGGINADRYPDEVEPDDDDTPPPAIENSPLVPSLPLRSQEEVDEREASSQMRLDFTNNSFIASRLWEIERAYQALPLPGAAADRFPDALLHSFSPERARAIRDWLDEFARAFDSRREAQNVAAE